ncbi:hypothetical protein WR25_04000 [Diploscapter pachys]|uniref:Uncharacterized protein n=1 Tax=Diploscapter pachys TaxID=2018661 RepID=A0A2A2JAN9_9BILA|nr:hypothetical protein WR25_04000 [Diploscapter pachys]
MNYCKKLFPPYYKYAVFLFAGFEMIYVTFTLAVSEAYYNSADKILPIVYDMFDDTVKRHKPGFEWTAEEKSQLEMYKMKMMLLYVLSTLGIVICMIIIIPQFFDFNNKRGYRSHLCLVSPKVAWIKFSILAIYVLLLGMAILWVWLDCKSIVTNFFSNFNYAATGEEFVHRLESEFNCVSDDDKEGYDPSKVSPSYAESITFSERSTSIGSSETSPYRDMAIWEAG